MEDCNRYIQLFNLFFFMTSILGEFGHEERGVGDRVAGETWIAAHNRRNHLFLGHWASINNAERKETVAKIRMVKGGMELKNGNNNEHKSPTSIYEVSECLRLKETVKKLLF